MAEVIYYPEVSMKAVVIEHFGGIDEMQLKDVPTPQPEPNEVQIQIHYASVNPVDWKIREGWLKKILNYQFPQVDM